MTLVGHCKQQVHCDSIVLQSTWLMPLYEYRCRQCGNAFEYLVLHSSPQAQCPSCSGQDLEQLISSCAVSSDSTKQANLSAAHRRAAAVRNDRTRQQHTHLHEHFEDKVTPVGNSNENKNPE